MKLSEIDLNLLVILDALIKEKSVTGAGRSVGLSQPAASGALRRLRELLDDPLIERIGGQSRLTPFALTLEQPLQQVLATIDNTFNRRVDFNPATSQRKFRIAASDGVAAVFLQPLITRLRDLAPRVSLEVQRPDKDTPQKLANRQVEISIEPEGRYRNREFSSQRLFHDHFVVALWAENPAVGDTLTREQFFEFGHITYSTRPYAFTLADRCLGALAHRLNVKVVTDSFVSLAMFLCGTDLLAIVPERFGRKLRDSAQIRLLPAPVPMNDFHVAMIWPALYERDPAHLWLRGVMGELGESLSA